MYADPYTKIKVQLFGVVYTLGTYDPMEDGAAAFLHKHTRQFLKHARRLPDEESRQRLAMLYQDMILDSEIVTPIPRYLVLDQRSGHYRLSTPKRYTSQIDDAARFRESEARELCAANPHYVMRPAP